MSGTVTVLMMIEDLLFGPRAESILRKVRLNPQRYRPGVPLGEQVEGSACGLIDVGGKGPEAIQAITAIKDAGHPVVAFCGHTNEARRAEARAAGATIVATNGEVHGSLPALIAKALVHKPDPDCDHC
ncbi:MAG: hypothetical protein ACE5FN_08335 [Leptospirillia bacterium]